MILNYNDDAAANDVTICVAAVAIAAVVAASRNKVEIIIFGAEG